MHTEHNPLPRDPADLARDIERARERLGHTLAALAAKADVRAQAKQKAREIPGRVKTTGTAAARRGATTVRQRPVPAAAAAAAAAWAVAIALWWRDRPG